jgi:hypothetical protein
MRIKSDQIKTVRFAFILLTILVLSSWVQLNFFAFAANESLFLESYLFNGGFALISFMLLLLMNRKNPGVTGFVFMAASALKFIVFFFLFYPFYYSDGSITRIEFSSFFVPYAICLAAELLYFVKGR